MATPRSKIQNYPVVGVFHTQEDARDAIHALKAAGFTESEIGVAGRGSDDLNRTTTRDVDSDDDNYVGEGALAGVATGAGIGALWGLGILAGVLPVIGPAIAGGTLGVLLSSAAAGAAAAGLAGALVGMGLSSEEAEYYESEMKSGRIVVTVQAGSRRDEVIALMRQYGAYDMSTRESAQSATSSAVGAAGTTGMRASGNTIQAREEKLNVRKTPVETGEVSIRKEVHTEHKTIDVPVMKEEIVIERRAGSGQPAASGDMVSSGQEIRIPVREEQVDVEKQAVVSEEVTVGKRQVHGTEHVDETLRKEKIKVDKRGNVDVRDERK